MFVIRVFSVLHRVVVQVDLLDRSTLGQSPPPPPRFLAHSDAPLDEVTGPDSLTRVIHSAIGEVWDDPDEFTQQLTC